MTDSNMNDLFTFIQGGDLFANLPSRLPSAFKLPHTQEFSPLMPDMSHRSGYSSVMQTRLASTIVPSMPVAFTSVKPTMSKPMQNPGDEPHVKNVFPLNAQWRWNLAMSAPQPSNWPDSSPPQYPALFVPPHQMPADNAVKTATNMSDIQSFFSTPAFVPERTSLLMSTLVNDQDVSTETRNIAPLRRPSLDSLSSLQLPDPFEDIDGKESSTPTSRSTTSSDYESSTRSSPNPSGSTAPPSPQTRPKKKTPKMHSCPICQRAFPRPSGLQVHLNSHNGLKPFTCEFPSCDRKFTVRSNARRHLRTHGVNIASLESEKQPTSSQAGNNSDDFNTKKTDTSDNNSKVLRWIPHSLSGSTHASSAGDETFSSSRSDSGAESLIHPTSYTDIAGYWRQ